MKASCECLLLQTSSYFSYSASSHQRCTGSKLFPHCVNASVAAAVTVPDTEPAGSLSLFFSIAAEVGTTSSFAHECLGGFSSITRQPRTSDNRRQGTYCSLNADFSVSLLRLSAQEVYLSVLQFKGLPVTGTVLSEEDVGTSWGEVK